MSRSSSRVQTAAWEALALPSGSSGVCGVGASRRTSGRGEAGTAVSTGCAGAEEGILSWSRAAQAIIAIEGMRTVVGAGAPEMNALVNPGAISPTTMVRGTTSDEAWEGDPWRHVELASGRGAVHPAVFHGGNARALAVVVVEVIKLSACVFLSPTWRFSSC